MSCNRQAVSSQLAMGLYYDSSLALSVYWRVGEPYARIPDELIESNIFYIISTDVSSI